MKIVQVLLFVLSYCNKTSGIASNLHHIGNGQGSATASQVQLQCHTMYISMLVISLFALVHSWFAVAAKRVR